MHRPDWGTPIEESLAALDEVVRAGKVRHVAQANFAAWQVTEMHYLAQARSWAPVRLGQQMYNLLARRVEAEYAACAEHLALSTLAYNPLAAGLLTGKHGRPEDEPPPGTRFTKSMYRDRYWNPVQFAAVERLRGVADEAGLSLLELALRWVLARPLASGTLPGAPSHEQLVANLKPSKDHRWTRTRSTPATRCGKGSAVSRRPTTGERVPRGAARAPSRDPVRRPGPRPPFQEEDMCS